MKIVSYEGKIIGMLTVLQRVGRNSSNAALWKCQCSCGNVAVISQPVLAKNKRANCGCAKFQKGSMDPMYPRWKSMRERCTVKKSHAYKNYGGRGIKVCDEWLDFHAYKKWALDNGYEKHLHLDRIDNAKGYSPENCRFVTPQANLSNRRPVAEWNILQKQEYVW